MQIVLIRWGSLRLFHDPSRRSFREGTFYFRDEIIRTGTFHFRVEIIRAGTFHIRSETFREGTYYFHDETFSIRTANRNASQIY